ncbi:MAG: hypothetical protein H0T08_08010 [Acidobacteria bacterium]|jgi:hypothetical protein|nr:hypothetical protein [Acidobacteriota bacterium]
MKTKLLFESIKYDINLEILFSALLLIALLPNLHIFAQSQTRTLSGKVLTQQFELVRNVSIEVQTSEGKLR